MKNPLTRREPSQRERAADGSMTLIEHIKELRDRLFKASLGVILGLIVGFIVAQDVFDLLKVPYCNLPRDPGTDCEFIQLGPADAFILKLKLALWVGLIVGAPVWLYQLWAFVAPGLHRHERKWAYIFAAIAGPLFAAGAILAYVVVEKGLAFLLEAGVTGVEQSLEVTQYISFVTGMILLFGISFEFPLLLLMLNFTGVLTGRRMLGWWRIAVFLAFVFAAVTTPDPGPFGMTLFAGVLSLLYFIAVGVSMLNDRRKGRGKPVYEGLSDDETSSLDDYDTDSITPGERIEAVAPVAGAEPIERRYDDMT
nr:twin-arginine translocase subunit TatC [Catellatospora bangladeshensis]